MSADPGLSQGRGGACDHRRCGTIFAPQCSAVSTSHPGPTCALHSSP